MSQTADPRTSKRETLRGSKNELEGSHLKSAARLGFFLGIRAWRSPFLPPLLQMMAVGSVRREAIYPSRSVDLFNCSRGKWLLPLKCMKANTFQKMPHAEVGVRGESF